MFVFVGFFKKIKIWSFKNLFSWIFSCFLFSGFFLAVFLENFGFIFLVLFLVYISLLFIFSCYLKWFLNKFLRIWNFLFFWFLFLVFSIFAVFYSSFKKKYSVIFKNLLYLYFFLLVFFCPFSWLSQYYFWGFKF